MHHPLVCLKLKLGQYCRYNTEKVITEYTIESTKNKQNEKKWKNEKRADKY